VIETKTPAWAVKLKAIASTVLETTNCDLKFISPTRIRVKPAPEGSILGTRRRNECRGIWLKINDPLFRRPCLHDLYRSLQLLNFLFLIAIRTGQPLNFGLQFLAFFLQIA